MFSVQRCSGRLLVQCVMYFLKQRLKVWQILEKKLKQNLEVLRSDLSKLKIATESAAGYVVYKPTSTKGPSIYDVHTEGGGGQPQVDAFGRREGVQPHVDVHTKN